MFFCLVVEFAFISPRFTRKFCYGLCWHRSRVPGLTFTAMLTVKELNIMPVVHWFYVWTSVQLRQQHANVHLTRILKIRFSATEGINSHKFLIVVDHGTQTIKLPKAERRLRCFILYKHMFVILACHLSFGGSMVEVSHWLSESYPFPLIWGSISEDIGLKNVRYRLQYYEEHVIQALL